MAKKGKKKKNLFLLADILLAVILIVVGVIIINPFKSDNKAKDKEEVKGTDENQNEGKDKEIVKEKTEEEIKLEKLNNINEKLDFFKMENLDRYIAYKEKNPNLDDETVVVYVNIGLDQEFYTNRKDSPFKDTNKVITNKFYFLGENYVPKDLVKISSANSARELYLQKDAAEAFERMANDAKKEGYTIRAVSTYRSYSYQQGLYNNYVNQDGKAAADTYSARAGYSEHQTGLAADIDNANLSYTSFGLSKEFNWMQENCYKYGFILRYTKANEFITGYKDEPWHYRYVGVEIATYIKEHPMTYEEYFVRFLDK